MGIDIGDLSHHLPLDWLRCVLWIGYETYLEEDLRQQSSYIDDC